VPAVTLIYKEKAIATSPDPHKEYIGTYFMDQSDQEELTRLTIQDQMLTTGMGGVFPEQADAATFRDVLDVGCGTGNWLIQAAQTYPSIRRLIGVDISHHMIGYARSQAQAQQVQKRIEYHVMDALLMLEFPASSLDLVNMRLGGSFLRTWEWPKILQEFQRVIRPGGTLRIVESDLVKESSSPALNKLSQALVQAFHRAGYFFTPQHYGLIEQLPDLFRRFRAEQVQTRLYRLEFCAGTPACAHFIVDMQHIFRTMPPFLRKWGCLPEDYDATCQQACNEMKRPDFIAYWGMFVIWGRKDPQ
jgi:ubiquinone/menaquinone biosynthesis C-methylase UbiE